ncbi:hypothetical protein AYY19_11895 [Photobacterium aquimaris]|uniref:GEVED domain-containing protein n=1 Tax=Photobacterium aquimaris TaxID=512643 RepID=UPI0007EF0815|nr:GEVED domain-containing protein [Photobacterium aquimaris]OBU17840.1 hypothetical protein AYY19_11895 [Photobacterium aquimaris]PSW02445.1 DUF11 domain-containing protein [Photobacterium aquimaris]
MIFKKYNNYQQITFSIITLLMFFCTVFFSAAIHAAHWRGGGITWSPVALDADGIKNDVIISLKTACHVNRSDCNGNRVTVSGGSKTYLGVITNQIINGEYKLEVSETQIKDVDVNTTYFANYGSCCRINLKNNSGGSWNIQSTILVQGGNRAPLIDFPILFQVPQKDTDGSVLTNYTIKIPALDPDGDNIKFRVGNTSEMGGGGNPPGLTIDESTGVLTWNNSGTLSPGLYSAGIVVEDVDNNGVIKSKTHFDVLFKLVDKPVVNYIAFTDSEVIVKKGDSYTFNVTGNNIDVMSLGDISGALVETGVDEFTFTPGPVGSGLDPGIYPMTFQVVDTTNNFVHGYFTVTYIVPDPNAPEILNINGDKSLYIMGLVASLDVNADAVSTDIDSVTLNGGQLKINVAYKDAANEITFVESVGDGTGEIRVDAQNKVYYEGVLFGEIDIINDGVGMPLQINFIDDAATTTTAAGLMKAIRYQNNSSIVGNRDISIYIEDDTGLSNIYAMSTDVLQGDMGDALLAGNDVFHGEADSDGNYIMDLRLGTLWDPNINEQDKLALADDNDNLADDDGVTFSTPFIDINNDLELTIEIQEEVDNGRQLHAWVDFNQDGVWEVSEKVINDNSAIVGSKLYSITIPNNTLLGYSFLRVRLCSLNTSCDTPNSISYDGEVEDYRLYFSDLIANTICDVILRTDSVGGSNAALSQLDPASNPMAFTTLSSPITIAGHPTVTDINSFGFNRILGLFYGIFYSGDDAYLFNTDRMGNSFIGLDSITANGAQSLTHTTHGVINFADGDALALTVGGNAIGSVTMGDISTDGLYLYASSPSLKGLIKIALASGTFEVIPLTQYIHDGDIAVNTETDTIYATKMATGKLSSITAQGSVTEQNIIYSGGLFPQDNSGEAISGGLIADKSYNIYAFVNNGDHDTNQDGSYDLINKSAIYKINVLTRKMTFFAEGQDINIVDQDIAGCYYSRDYGDAVTSYGIAGHGYHDSASNGNQDLALGSLWDSELSTKEDSAANADLEDDGVNVPASITVGVPAQVAVTVPASTGFLNVFVDLNGDGDFNDTDEHIENDKAISQQTTNLEITIDPAQTDSYNGDSIMRFRLCSTAGACNSAASVAADGEVEDYQFRLINQIVLNGNIFEDNGLGAATAAHDGIIDGNEVGIAGFTVRALFNGSIAAAGYNPGDVVATDISGGTGQYSLIIPVILAGKSLKLEVVSQAKWIDISENNGSHSQVTSATVTDSQMVVIASAGDNLKNINFGKVQQPVMNPDNYSEIEPGKMIAFHHNFKANTSGSVTFSIVDKVVTPANSDWSTVLKHNVDCDDQINNNQTILSSINVDADTNKEVCLVVQVFIPADASLNSLFNYNIKAVMVFDDTTSTAHGVTKTVIDSDTVRAVFSGAGTLKLEKKVANITTSNGNDISNTAKPGEVLEYTVIFTNTGSGNIKEVVILDTVPEHTSLNSSINCTAGTIPAGLTCNFIPIAPLNASGYRGNVKWILTGTLRPGESGSVVYRVNID